MNVTCPSCTTIYRVDPAKVPEAGVRARCKVCSAIFPVTKAVPVAAGAAPADLDVTHRRPAVDPLAAGADLDATTRRPAVVPTAAPVDADATLKRPAVTPTPMVADAEATMRRPAIPAIDPDQTAPRAPVEVEETGPRPMLVGDHDIETTAKRVSMPPDLDETARRRPVDPLSPPAASMQARPAPAMPPASPVLPPPLMGRPGVAPPPAVPGGPRPTAPRQFPPPAGAPPRGGAMPPPAVRSTVAAPPAPPLTPPGPPLVPPGPPKAPPAAAPAAAAAAPVRPAGRPVNPFLTQDPSQKARRLARALISDLAVYYPDRRKEGLAQGTLKQLFQEEIQKSWEEFTEQVGRELAESTTYFNDALNEILAGGQKVF